MGRSILTLKNKDKNDEGSPDSIFPLLQDAGLNELFLVDDNFSGFLEANKTCEQRKVKLNFGLRLTLCDDIDQKDDEGKNSNSKIILLGKTPEAYERLIEIYTIASTGGFFEESRVDCSVLKKKWNDKDLSAIFPFYDSYLFNNVLTNKICHPDIFFDPVYLVEDNDLPFDDIITDKLSEIDGEQIKAQSIYYSERKDFQAYLTMRCLGKRATLDMPNCEHMSSDSFCFESWEEKQ